MSLMCIFMHFFIRIFSGVKMEAEPQSSLAKRKRFLMKKFLVERIIC